MDESRVVVAFLSYTLTSDRADTAFKCDSKAKGV